MIEIFEQYGFDKKQRRLNSLSDSCRTRLNVERSYSRYVIRKNESQSCYQIYFDKTDNDYHFETSYFVGLDWVDLEKNLKIKVNPKLNDNDREINYLSILLESLQDSENLNHLEDLINIDFDKPYIETTHKEDILSPFLIAQFLYLTKKIVQKGLKKSYYTVNENLNNKIKGKIIIPKNIKENTLKFKNTYVFCKYLEFGVNCDENKILKKAYLFSRRVIQEFKNSFDTRPLLDMINFIHPAFNSVSDDIDINRIKNFKLNPLYKEYELALKYALLILKKYSYNITRTQQEKISTPPYWIDMSKLFELYVFKKLRNIFLSNEIRYHLKAKYQELDFLLKSQVNNLLFVIDTKYKPRYYEHGISIDDIRQISGYARLERVYEGLSITDRNMNINCLIIYSHQDCDEFLTLDHFVFDENNNDIKKIRKEKGYVNIYKLGIKLPEL